MIDQVGLNDDETLATEMTSVGNTTVREASTTGYKIEEILLSDKIQDISATKIRKKLREQGKLK